MVDEREKSWGVTLCQYLSDCHLHTWMVLLDPVAILQQHTVTSDTSELTGFSPIQTVLMKEEF